MEPIETIDDIREHMEAQMNSGGQYIHNAVSCLLRIAAAKFGKRSANKLIDDYNLTKLYGIRKEKE